MTTKKPAPASGVISFDLLDPAGHAAALMKIGRPIGVEDWARWTIEACTNAWSNEACPDRSTITYVEHNLAFFTRGMATLEAVDMPAEARSMIRSAVQAAFEIGVVGGNLQQALHARKDMPRAIAERVWEGRKKATAEAEARRTKELDIIEKNKWSLDGDG